jgi:hypothetical protein
MANTITIDTKPAEEGTAVVTVAFTDHDGVAVSPNAGTLTWTLTDGRGTVINLRTDVAITSAASVTIVLSGDDLAITTPTGAKRIITVEGLYNSTDGNNLPIKVQGVFTIQEFVAVT